MVVRGFQEIVKLKADAPTGSRESFRVFLTLTANENFVLRAFDVSSAFLQSKPIDRNIIIRPPKDVKKKGKMWKLNKACYGLVDASRQFYLSVKEQLEEYGMKMVDQDEAFFYHHDDEGNLDGLFILHVDDFLVSGKKGFLENLEDHLTKRFDFGKMVESNFKYTGVKIEQKPNKAIYVDQIDYIKEIEELNFGTNKVGVVNEDEQKRYRSLTGQLLWAAEVTRLDISFNVRELCTKNMKATYKDVKEANKVVEKLKREELKIAFKPLGRYEDLKIKVFTDAAFRNSEDKVKSVEGRIIVVENLEGHRSVISAKSSTISKVCKSVKNCRNTSIRKWNGKAIAIARMIGEIKIGKKYRGSQSIPT